MKSYDAQMSAEHKCFRLSAIAPRFIVGAHQHMQVLTKTWKAQGPHSQILMTGGGGGSAEVHILYPKRSQLQYLSTQKNHF